MKRFPLKSTILGALFLALSISGSQALAHNGEVHAEPDMSHAEVTLAQSTSTSDGVTVHVMQHLCNENIKDMDDFMALEAGKDPVAALANTVLNCPTTGLPGDEAVAGTVSSPRTSYDYTIMPSGTDNPKYMLDDATFMQHKICESDINKDVDGNGSVEASTCLDISHYELSDVTTQNGKLDVWQSHAPAGTHLGALRFTPPVIDGNNDEQSRLLTDHDKGLIKLDYTNDTDKTVMLHIYNFQHDDSSDNSSGTSTDSNGDSDMTKSEIMEEINDLQDQIRDLFDRIQDLLEQL